MPEQEMGTAERVVREFLGHMLDVSWRICISIVVIGILIVSAIAVIVGVVTVFAASAINGALAVIAGVFGFCCIYAGYKVMEDNDIEIWGGL